MNKKSDRMNFVIGVVGQILRFGGVQKSKPNVDTVEFEIQTPSPEGTQKITLTIEGEESHLDIYSVFMRFETVVPGVQNQFSGKHNFHSIFAVQTAIKDFRNHLIEAILLTIDFDRMAEQMKMYNPDDKDSFMEMQFGMLPNHMDKLFDWLDLVSKMTDELNTEDEDGNPVVINWKQLVRECLNNKF